MTKMIVTVCNDFLILLPLKWCLKCFEPGVQPIAVSSQRDFSVLRQQ